MEEEMIATTTALPETQISSLFQSSSSSARIICRVCEKQFSQYTCPRCNTRYCSLPCYKSHSLRCTESFMRDNVMDEMKHMRSNDQTKSKMMEILKRFHAQDQDPEEEETMDDQDGPALSEDTIQKVMSGGELNYEDLTAEEKKLFQRAIASGELSKLIEPWEPWWLKPCAKTIYLSEQGNRLVQPLTRGESSTSIPQDDSEHTLESEVPAGPDAPLPPLKKLTLTEPSPLLSVHLVDIIYSYCFTLRLYNGEWQSDAVGASMVVLSVSSVLGQGEFPESLLEAVSNCLEQTCSPTFRHMGGLEYGFGLLDDVASLISLGGDVLVCALSDLHRMMVAGQRELKRLKQRTDKAEIKNKLKCAERKVHFIMCWVHEQPQQLWSSLMVLVTAEKASQLDYRGNGKRSFTTAQETNNKSKTLVEEV